MFQTLYFIIDLYFVAGLGAAAGPAIWLSLQPWARLEHIWWLSATSVAIHCLVALWFLRDQLKLKLAGLTPLGAVG